MLFSYKLDTSNQSSSIYSSFSNFVKKYNVYLLLMLISLAILASGFLLYSLTLCVAGSASVYAYRLYNDVSSISFEVGLDGFSLQDVINDLEHQ